MIELEGISKRFIGGEVETSALAGVNLSIGAGEYVAITGPSGCGKSTLLSILGLLDVPDAGNYSLDGEPLCGLSEAALNGIRKGKIGFIFQNFNLIDELTVAENVSLALSYASVTRSERQQRTQDMLQKLGLWHRANHFPAQLSGGQQQRVAIARALVASPQVLLADEPTGNLDSAHGDEVMRLLKEINASGTTVVMVTHSPEHAIQADRVITMLDGRIVEAGQSSAAARAAAVA
ncbi:ABC transporter ATP-binding protein [Massilia sp. BJB1822]|uniref:ABC transporter ATP-binding protein n=1 Tax=Massilia sp. BJB1822 TaxID=2744470 RepID=UPI0015941710|nr:ABC transporter ATP-binding protein [Massilia sp. BJB1822]NVE00641.1 ABC transporter ATP-binding protein [Massilia sp. BJB1822]